MNVVAPSKVKLSPSRKGLRGLSEALGLSPWTLAATQTRMTFAGDAFVPKSRFGLSSLNILHPALALMTWLGQVPDPRSTVIFNLFNHTQTPIEEGWSVRKTQPLDFRGKKLTYDSHNGTDFCLPPGTEIVAAAPGRVIAMRREFHRGGLKIYVDHGRGLVTTYNHLGRPLVRVGDWVERAEVLALSGASGLDSVALFPWVAPHLHFNVWLGGVPVDPFARLGTDEASLWRGAPKDGRVLPVPASDEEPSDREPWSPSVEMDEVEALLALCKDAAFVRATRAIRDPYERAGHALVEAVTYPTRFQGAHPAGQLFKTAARREPRLDLPLSRQSWDGIVFPDER